MNSPYFDNAVITELEQDRQKITILRYKPKPEWYYSAERDIKKFSGTIEFYTATGELLGKLSMLDGEGIEEPEGQKGFSTNCTYTFNNSLCVKYAHKEKYLCTFEYTESCTTTYTSTLGSPIDTDEALDQGNSNGGTGGSTTTTTIVVEEVVKVENNLTDPCAKNIFGNLKL